MLEKKPEMLPLMRFSKASDRTAEVVLPAPPWTKDRTVCAASERMSPLPPATMVAPAPIVVRVLAVMDVSANVAPKARMPPALASATTLAVLALSETMSTSPPAVRRDDPAREAVTVVFMTPEARVPVAPTRANVSPWDPDAYTSRPARPSSLRADPMEMSPPAVTASASMDAETPEVFQPLAEDVPTVRPETSDLPVADARAVLRAWASTSTSLSTETLPPIPACTSGDTVAAALLPLPDTTPPVEALAVELAVSTVPAATFRFDAPATVPSMVACVRPSTTVVELITLAAAPPYDAPSASEMALLALKALRSMSPPAVRVAPIPTSAVTAADAVAVAEHPWPLANPPAVAPTRAVAPVLASSAPLTSTLCSALTAIPPAVTIAVAPMDAVTSGDNCASARTTPMPARPTVRPSPLALALPFDVEATESRPLTAMMAPSSTKAWIRGVTTASTSAPLPARMPPPEALA